MQKQKINAKCKKKKNTKHSLHVLEDFLLQDRSLSPEVQMNSIVQYHCKKKKVVKRNKMWDYGEKKRERKTQGREKCFLSYKFDFIS